MSQPAKLIEVAEDPLPAKRSARVRRLGLHTQREPIVVMRTDCPVCRAEGLSPRSQVLLQAGDRELTAILLQQETGPLRQGEIGLSEAAWKLFGAVEGEWVGISQAPPLDSLGRVRSRIYGEPLDQAEMDSIVRDIVAGRYTAVHLAAFLTSGSALPLSDAETIAPVSAIVSA